MHLRLDVGCLWYFRIRRPSRPNFSQFLHFFGDRSSVIFFSKFFLYIIYLIWISRLCFDPWDGRKFFGLITCGSWCARVSATLQVFTPKWKWFLMALLVDCVSLEMCGMHWVLSLCGRKGRWRRGSAHGGRRMREQPWMRHVTHQMTELILEHKDACKSRLVLNLSQAKRIEWAVRAVIKLYCTNVSCEWASTELVWTSICRCPFLPFLPPLFILPFSLSLSPSLRIFPVLSFLSMSKMKMTRNMSSSWNSTNSKCCWTVRSKCVVLACPQMYQNLRYTFAFVLLKAYKRICWWFKSFSFPQWYCLTVWIGAFHVQRTFITMSLSVWDFAHDPILNFSNFFVDFFHLFFIL